MVELDVDGGVAGKDEMMSGSAGNYELDGFYSLNIHNPKADKDSEEIILYSGKGIPFSKKKYISK